MARSWFRKSAAPSEAAVEHPPPVRRGITTNALLASMTKPDKEHPFVIPTPPPGVVPQGAPQMAQDNALCGAYAYAQGSALGEGIVWPGYAYLSELAQRPEYRRISETIAKEMTRKWIKLQGAGGTDKTDRIKCLERALDRFRVQETFRRASEHDGFFGRGQIYIDTGHSDDPDELAIPLTVAATKIPRGGLKRLATVEPVWTYPTGYNSTNPLSPEYYRPTSWFVMGRRVHATRLLTFVGREMPDLLKPAYNFGGLSMSQMAKPYVDNWLRTRQSVSDLLHSFSTMVLATDMQADLGGAPGALDALARAQMFNNYRDNRGLMLIDKEQEALSNVSTPLGTLDHLQAQSQEQMASVSGIPLVVLLGITPSGLNASSDGEIRAFYSWIEAQQEQLFSLNLRRVIDIIQLSEFGEIDPDITFRFEPLWSLDEAGRAAVRKVDADTDAVYIEAGVLDPNEVRQRIATAEDSVYHGLDLNEPAPGLPDHEDMGGLSDPAEGIASAGAKGGETGANAGD